MQHLDWNYRLKLIKQHIERLNCDVVCLQEVRTVAALAITLDTDWLICHLQVEYDKYDEDLLPFMAARGFGGVLQGRDDSEEQRASDQDQAQEQHQEQERDLEDSVTTHEGKRKWVRTLANATFFRLSKFALCPQTAHRSRTLCVTLSFVDGTQCSGHDALIHVANFHLQGDPKEGHVRAKQSRNIAQWIQENDSDYVIIAGDFNDDHPSSCTECLLEPQRCSSYQQFKRLHHRLLLECAYKKHRPTYVSRHTQSQIDHIFHSTNMTPTATLDPSMGHHDVIRAHGLPNAVCPSDHLPIAATFFLGPDPRPELMFEEDDVIVPADVSTAWRLLLAAKPPQPRQRPTPEELTCLRQHAQEKKRFLNKLRDERLREAVSKLKL